MNNISEIHPASYRPTRRTCRDGKEPQPLELLDEWFDENGIDRAAAARALDLIDAHAAHESRLAAAEAVFAVLGRLERVNATGAALSWILRATPQSQTELAKRLGISQQAISKQIRALSVHFDDMILPE